LKGRAVSIEEDDGDDNSNCEFWEFIDPDELESLIKKMYSMTSSTHFVHKFRNIPTFFPIFYDELVKKVLINGGSTVLIHCETRGDEPYMFTICIEYSKSPFHLPTFLKSLENTDYKSLMREVQEQVD
jgi:hypothetical protein